MLGIGFQELLLILVVAVVVVGPKKLPDLAKSLGKGVRELRKYTDDLKSNFQDNEAYKDLQGLKSSMQDTVSSLNPKGLLDLEAKAAVPAQPAPELKRFEAPAPVEEAAAPLLEPKKPEERLEGRLAVMDDIVGEHHPSTPLEPAAPAAGQAAVADEAEAVPAGAGPAAMPPASEQPPAAASTPAPRKADA